MADDAIPVPRISDDRIIDFFERLSKDSGYAPAFQISGSDKQFGFGTEELEHVRTAAKHSIQTVRINKVDPQNQNRSFALTFRRNKQTSATPDIVQLVNNNEFEHFSKILAITEAISVSFALSDLRGAAYQAEPEAFAKVISAHHDIIGALERNLANVSTKFTEERLKLQTEQAEFIKAKQAEYDQHRQQLETTYQEQHTKLIEREKQLDNRDNMHARRGIREDIKRRLLQYSEKFSLTDRTQQLRWRVHGAVWFATAVISAGIWYLYTREIPNNANNVVVYMYAAKTGLLTVALLGLLTWYIRWMNRWFDRHADAEFGLKQFELDVDRASWVVETAMEWRAQQNGVIPTHLLESMSRNLFQRGERSEDNEMHPADYLASAILGKAARARISVAGNEIELDRRSLKDIQRDKS